jgi:hypothetical protein
MHKGSVARRDRLFHAPPPPPRTPGSPRSPASRCPARRQPPGRPNAAGAIPCRRAVLSGRVQVVRHHKHTTNGPAPIPSTNRGGTSAIGPAASTSSCRTDARPAATSPLPRRVLSLKRMQGCLWGSMSHIEDILEDILAFASGSEPGVVGAPVANYSSSAIIVRTIHSCHLPASRGPDRLTCLVAWELFLPGHLVEPPHISLEVGREASHRHSETVRPVAF